VFYRGANVLGVWDAYPVSDGHALIITKQHVPTWFDASREEQTELLSALAIAREAISSKHRPDGFNIGVNIGEAAGQTVPDLHVHLIPRYKNDVVDPRGGDRRIDDRPDLVKKILKGATVQVGDSPAPMTRDSIRDPVWFLIPLRQEVLKQSIARREKGLQMSNAL